MAVILCVDDELSVRISIKNFLEDLGHTVIEASEGLQGFNLFKQERPDLVLLDLKMPKMGGIELLSRIIQESPNTPVIVISGTGVLDDVVNALRNGAWNYLLKPIVELGVLQHAVDQALEKAKLQQDNQNYQTFLEASLKQRTHELANLVNNMPIAIYRMQNDNGHFIEMNNPEFSRMFGYESKQEFNQIKIEHLFATTQDAQSFLEKLFQNGRVISEEVKMRRKDGSEFWGAITAHVILDDRGITSHVDGAIQDITDRKNAEADIQHKAYHDPLTDLPNRSLLVERLQHDMSLCQRNNTFGALLFIDLDHFKTINDALGHNIGDELLIQIARRLKTIIRSSDTVARLGGDEFVILLANLHSDYQSANYQALSIAEKALDEITQPYHLKGHQYHQTASIGIVTFPDAQATSVHDLLKWADTAMYNVKRNGRNDIQFFNPEMQKEANKRLELEKQLQHHLTEEKFSLCYQPQTDVEGKLISAESLLRLEESKEDISPEEFVPVAEDTGLIHKIGDWVLEEVFKMVVFINQNHNQLIEHLSINISACQFYKDDFVDIVKSLVYKYKINPNQIVLEITESLLMYKIETIIEKMTELKKLGIRFSIDDFGTGFSSLAYLKKLPIDELKIDKSFIDDISESEEAMVLVKTIIVMAKQLNITIIAEGVETLEQLKLLHDAGCDYYQGFYYSKPIYANEFKGLIEKSQVSDIRFKKTA